jgi:hypothetical protein
MGEVFFSSRSVEKAKKDSPTPDCAGEWDLRVVVAHKKSKRSPDLLLKRRLRAGRHRRRPLAVCASLHAAFEADRVVLQSGTMRQNSHESAVAWQRQLLGGRQWAKCDRH